MRRFVWTVALAVIAVGTLGCGPSSPTSVSLPPHPPTVAPAAALTVPTAVKSGQVISLGNFQVVSDRLLVSDPGYELEKGGPSGLQAEVKPVRAGDWRAEALLYKPEPNDERCAELRVFYAKHGHSGACDWKPMPTAIGVDSGQAGIFDPKHYRDQAVVPKNHKWREEMIDPEDRWYSLCCDFTLTGNAGVIPYGTVASSGYGDGGYMALVCENDAGQVQGVRLVFISQEDEE